MTQTTYITTSGSITFDGPHSVGPVSTSGQFVGIPPLMLQQWLTAAQIALNDLLTGGSVSMALYNAGEGSRQVSYTRAQIPQLRAYIDDLAAAVFGSVGRRRSAIGVRFGR